MAVFFFIKAHFSAELKRHFDTRKPLIRVCVILPLLPVCRRRLVDVRVGQYCTSVHSKNVWNKRKQKEATLLAAPPPPLPQALTLPLLLLQSSDDPLQLPSLLPLHGLQDLGGTLGLTVGGALASQRLAVLQDEGVLVVPVCR